VGKFPIIIYGSSQGSSGYDNSLLCEQLASHGYIVFTIASKGAYSRQMPFNEEGAEAQTRDLEFLYGLAYNYPSSDPKKVGLVGFSFGGLNNITFSLKNTQVKAIVSLDGSISSPLGYQILNSYSYLNIKNFNSNFLGFLGDKSETDNFSLFDEAFLSDMYLLKLSQLNHLDFSSFNLMIKDRPNFVYDAYVDMANLTVKFMNQNFKKESDFEHAIANYSTSIYSAIREKKSIGNPQVTKEEYINYIEQNGIDKGIQLYYDTKKLFPEYKLFDYDPFRDVGFLKMIEKDYENAIKVYKVLLEEFPNNSDSYRRLGEAYLEHGNYFEARRLINKGLQLDPESPAMKDILKIINERDKE
jgi:tetratricopeptide (TPR) repeat protein